MQVIQAFQWENIMNWKIKEFTVRAFFQEGVGMLVRIGTVSSNALAGASAYNLHSHPAICGGWRAPGSGCHFILRLIQLESAKSTHDSNPHTCLCCALEPERHFLRDLFLLFCILPPQTQICTIYLVTMCVLFIHSLRAPSS